ncbi:MAG: L,D-transpeptidase [Anaerolineae bacterium]|nr:L,D-transpeptidase [Anaerolineae bacterium]NUQ02488.1 L,D-transpeptidase [Anaerolineae bacterium]
MSVWRLTVLTVIALSLSVAVRASKANEHPCDPCGLSTEAISAYPNPQVEQLAANEFLLYDRRYERVVESVVVYDAPNGTAVNTIDIGFNFVTALDSQAGWTQINVGQWVLSNYLRDTQPSRFAGILLPDTPLPYALGWILVNTVPSRTPGAEPVEGDLALLRYTVVNLYATVAVDGWNWYQVGDAQWIEQRLIARALPIERAPEIDTHKWVSVDLYEQVVIAYEGDRAVFATLVSSGLTDWPTNEGLFHIYVRYPRTVMSGAHGQPDFYYLEEVPWTMYFDGDIGLHGTYWHDGFGYRHSHGCVNLSITDSAWLYQWADSEIDLTVPGDIGAAVYVFSSGQYQ